MPSNPVDKLRRYEKISFLGEGQFATVYKAKDIEFGKDKDKRKGGNGDGDGDGDGEEESEGESVNESDAIVAVKKIKLGSRAEAKDGINRTALREIKLLQEISHENVICLRDVFGYQSSISLVMDFMDTDLEVIIKDTGLVLAPANIKSYVLQTFLGLEYLHNNWILHRDLKPNNLLVNRKGIVKITDFGLAKAFGSPNRQYTHLVVTRWYRSPELLFGARIYGVGIDIWAMGCILAELLLRVPLVPGETDLDQLGKIFQAMGTPTQETWPDHQLLPDFVTFKSFPGTPLQDIFIAAGPDLIQVRLVILSRLIFFSLTFFFCL
jgi:cyclin-dependent kinase 7